MISFNENIYALSFLFLFLALFIFFLTAIQFIRKQQRKQQMVKRIRQEEYPLEKLVENKDTPDYKKKRASGWVLFFTLFNPRKKAQDLSAHEAVNLKFLRAGITRKNFDTAFFGAKICLPILFLVIFFILKLFIFRLMETQMTVIVTVVVGLLGFYLPDIWLRQITDKRKERLFKGLPDALDLLVVCVEAGMGLDSAIHRVGQEIKVSNPDLSNEFALMTLEMRAGKSRQEALKNLSARTDIAEMSSLVTLLIQTDKFGTSVAKALTTFSDSFRVKRFQKAEEIAAKLPVKILIPLIFFIFPALFIVILGPAVINIYHNFIAR